MFLIFLFSVLIEEDFLNTEKLLSVGLTQLYQTTAELSQCDISMHSKCGLFLTLEHNTLLALDINGKNMGF